MFKNTSNQKTKEFLDKGLELYKEERLLSINREVEEFRLDKTEEIKRLALICAKDTAEYEHTFHQTKENKRVELAKLEAKLENIQEIIDAKQENAKAKDVLIKSKDDEIGRLNKIIEKLIENQPNTTIQQLK